MGGFGFSSAACTGDLAELLCSLHVLKRDNKYQLGVCLGQNSFFLLIPVETTQAWSAAPSGHAPGTLCCSQAAAAWTLRIPSGHPCCEGWLGWCEGLLLSLTALSILTRSLYCKPLALA